jgi:PPOX class probable F420-dependent enzyme
VALAIDTSTPFGARVERRLRDERLAWLVTVSPQGAPQPSRVWFLRQGDSFLLYTKPDTPKLRNIAANPRVALHLDGDDRGGDLVIVSGTAVRSDDPPADQVPEYVRKYREFFARNGWSAADFAQSYSEPIRIAATRLRGY